MKKIILCSLLLSSVSFPIFCMKRKRKFTPVDRDQITKRIDFILKKLSNQPITQDQSGNNVQQIKCSSPLANLIVSLTACIENIDLHNNQKEMIETIWALQIDPNFPNILIRKNSTNSKNLNANQLMNEIAQQLLKLLNLDKKEVISPASLTTVPQEISNVDNWKCYIVQSEFSLVLKYISQLARLQTYSSRGKGTNFKQLYFWVKTIELDKAQHFFPFLLK